MCYILTCNFVIEVINWVVPSQALTFFRPGETQPWVHIMYAWWRHTCAGSIAVYCRKSVGQAPSPRPSRSYTGTGKALGDTLTWCCSSGKILEGQFSKGKKEALIWAVLHSSLLKCYHSAHTNVRALDRVFTFLQALIPPSILKIGSLPQNREISHFLFHQTSLLWSNP